MAFQTQGLSTELHFVGTVRLGTAALIFHRVRDSTRGRGMKLDHIGHAQQAQRGFFQGHGCHRPHPMSLFGEGRIGPGMEQAPLGRLPVLGPEPFDMNQGALTRAVPVVLEGGEWNEVVLFHDAALCP